VTSTTLTTTPNTVYFPTEQDWMLTSRPSRIPLAERFPQHLAVNNTPAAGRKPPRPAVRLPPSRTPGRDGPPQSQTRQRPGQQRQDGTDPVSRLMNRSQPNLVPLGRGREEGKLSDMADVDSLLGHLDNGNVTNGPDWWEEPPLMAGGWYNQLRDL
jgi:hypothetical protein